MLGAHHMHTCDMHVNPAYQVQMEQYMHDMQCSIMAAVHARVTHCNTDAQLLSYARRVVRMHAHDMTHARNWHAHVHHAHALHDIKCKHCMRALRAYLYNWITLELAIRYA